MSRAGVCGGATGSLGGKVVDELLGRGKKVRALVRPATDANGLESPGGGEIARGDMLDVDSLVAAMNGADAVIATAAGHTRGGKNAHDIDTVGIANLAEAAHRAGIRRFVLTSILTSDRTPHVPHFWHKKVAEDKLEQLGVPFVALRPGAFVDQIANMAGDPIDQGRLIWAGKTTVPLTFVHTSDLAAYPAAAVDAEADDGERIDIGWDRPVGMREMAELMGTGPERTSRCGPSLPPSPAPREPSPAASSPWSRTWSRCSAGSTRAATNGAAACCSQPRAPRRHSPTGP
ncbi:SDR family oxidoreductase [Streptomyces sp. NPDC050164]|uniref:SDR family oxidoreductase n=1 Tax=Streptomyces sp. NPDC050164 TaxID=3365605 RepID=UPI00378C01FC